MFVRLLVYFMCVYHVSICVHMYHILCLCVCVSVCIPCVSCLHICVYHVSISVCIISPCVYVYHISESVYIMSTSVYVNVYHVSVYKKRNNIPHYTQRALCTLTDQLLRASLLECQTESEKRSLSI